jgi:2-methylaconitate cis-trans-isomerase PrpF
MSDYSVPDNPVPDNPVPAPGPAQTELPAVLMRGGTSKGVFFHLRDLPAPGPARDRLLLSLMGSPDPMQIDGLGGSYSSTSKVMVVARCADDAADVSYWFAQIGVDTALVDWSGNCGNLTTAIGPFAIDEGLHPATEPVTQLRLRNENTGVLVDARVPVAGGRAVVTGDLRVPGVPEPGAPVETNYRNPGGGVLGATFPTGRVTDTVTTSAGPVPVSILDVTHPCAFVRASDLGVSLSTLAPAAANADPALLARFEEVRAACSVLLGVAPDPATAATAAPIVPRLVLVGPDEPPADPIHGDLARIRAVGLSMGKVHHALPMTAALCLSAAASVAGTIPGECAQPAGPGQPLTVRHPKGVVALTAEVSGPGSAASVTAVGVVRTARRLMSGTVYVRPA